MKNLVFWIVLLILLSSVESEKDSKSSNTKSRKTTEESVKDVRTTKEPHKNMKTTEEPPKEEKSTVEPLKNGETAEETSIARVIYDIIVAESPSQVIFKIPKSSTDFHNEIIYKIIQNSEQTGRYFPITLGYVYSKKSLFIFLFETFAEYLEMQKFSVFRELKGFKKVLFIGSIGSNTRYIDEEEVFHLVESNETINIMAIKMFTEQSCRASKLVIINSFDKIKMKWKTNLDTHTLDEYRNFYGCKLIFSITNDPIFFPRQRYGIGHEILSILQSRYNVTVELVVDMRTDEDIDNQISPAYSTMLYRDMISSISLQTIRQFLMVSPNRRLLSDYEKQLSVFDESTWKYIIASFAAVFITIQIVNRFGYEAKWLIYGGYASSPTLNIIAIIFGVRQTTSYRFLPHTYSTRTLFIIFMFYCLIIRTCYQKVSFKLLSRDIFKDDYFYSPYHLMDLNYTFVSLQPFYEFPTKVIHGRELLEIMSHTCRSLKYAIVMDTLTIASLVHVIDRCEWIYVSLMKMSIVLTAHERGILSNELIELTNDLVTSGQIKFLFDRFFHHAFKNIQIPAGQTPRVITLHDLKFYFHIWFISLLVPIAVFLIEVILCRNRNKIKSEDKYLEESKFECINIPIEGENNGIEDGKQKLSDVDESDENSTDEDEEQTGNIKENETKVNSNVLEVSKDITLEVHDKIEPNSALPKEGA